MRQDPDALYTQMIAHYKGCAVCTAAHDCPEGHRLLMAYGRAEQDGAHESWVILEAERAAARGEVYIPDPGERSL